MKKVALIVAVLSFQIFSQVSLMDTTNQYDYIIVTVPEFAAACEVFAQHKENVRDLKTLVVDTTMIFNEFNSHTLRQDNIRDFISYAGTYWEEPQPKYFLLVGNLSMIPNFEIFFIHDTASSDFIYSQSIYDYDPLSVEFYVGRVPANSIGEINNYFYKVINYESDNQLYSWNNNTLFFTENDTAQFFQLKERATSVANRIPGYINTFFLYENDSSTTTYLFDSFLDIINNNGISSIWIFKLYFDSSLGNSNFFTVNDIELLSNTSKPFIVFDMSKQVFSNDTSISFNDKFLLSEGGSIAGIASTGISFYPSIIAYFQMYAANLYLKNTKSLGEILDVFPVGSYLKTVINLWGDPSLKLKYDVTVDVDPVIYSPTQYFLDQNYPNPFNPKTVINFSIPNAGNVELKVYNVLGKEIKVLTDKFYTAGNHKVEFDGSDLSSGVYLYTIRSGDFHQTRKMLLIK